MWEAVRSLVEKAGQKIMEHYAEAPRIEWKADDSPLTQADRAANELLCRGLGELTPAWPVLSEELPIPPFAERQGWGPFWLIDPLDGTKEFIQRNGEFTVNVALVEGGSVRFGVVGLPARRVIYHAESGHGAFRREPGEGSRRLRVPERPMGQRIRIAVSRSHPSAELDAKLKRLGPYEPIPLGSALKFCEIAEGRVDAYPRLQGLHEWDTAAAQIVAEEAGVLISDWHGQPLRYNKAELVHEGLLAVADAALQAHFLGAARME